MRKYLWIRELLTNVNIALHNHFALVKDVVDGTEADKFNSVEAVSTK